MPKFPIPKGLSLSLSQERFQKIRKEWQWDETSVALYLGPPRHIGRSHIYRYQPVCSQKCLATDSLERVTRFTIILSVRRAFARPKCPAGLWDFSTLLLASRHLMRGWMHARYALPRARPMIYGR